MAPTSELASASNYLESLNPEQRQAVEHFQGPLLVLAGAGSGKTRVLTSRISHLIHEHGISPNCIFAVTFTNKAAREMRDRVQRLLGAEPTGMWIGTFHSMSARILRRYSPHLGWPQNFTILDSDASLRVLKETQVSLEIDPKRWNPKAIRSQISAAKNNLITPQEFQEDHADGFDPFLRKAGQVFPAYQSALKEQGAFDFDDLLVGPVQLFESHPDILSEYRERFPFVLVDEYQDTNRAQFRFLELLAGNDSNLMVVGDDDQSIYGWRGADIRNILDFETTFPGATLVRLEQNYRSTRHILDAANAVISENRHRKGKTLRTEREAGESITLVETPDEVREARWITNEVEARVGGDLGYRSFAVLYRTNAQSRVLEDALRLKGLPYQIVGGVRFYERREIQDVLGYVRLISNPKDADAFRRVVNYPRRGIGTTSQVRLRDWASEQEVSLLEAAERAEEAPGLSKGAVNSLQRFVELIRRYSVKASQLGPGELLDELVEELDLYAELRKEGPEGEDRVENVKELIAGALEFNSALVAESTGEELDHFTELDLFLQNVALVADIDRHDPDADAITLMTLHNAKGLEFPVVFIAGLEEGLFPLGRSYESPEALEEERRLFYVGVTRAGDKLFLTYARERRRAGEFMYGMLSSFADSIPDTLLELKKLRRSGTDARDSRRKSGRTTFGSSAGRSSQSFGFEPDSNVGSNLDSDFNQDAPRFSTGERVVHGTFGGGSIVEISGFGRDLKVTVDFDNVGRKKLLVRYAELEKEIGGL